MNTLTTQGIEINVKHQFNRNHSNVHENFFFYNYLIEIKNTSNHNVQLLNREWYISDSLDTPKIIKGKGVIGKQPILLSKESFKYESGCQIISEIGYMKGKYEFINLDDHSIFEVKIPKFELVYPFKMN